MTHHPARPARGPGVRPPRGRSASRARAVEDFAFAVLAHGAAAAGLHARVAARVGLSAGDLQALDRIARYGPLTAGELGTHTGLASASVTGLIDRLEEPGFVRRLRDPRDARRVRVEARPDGLRRVGEALAAVGFDLEELVAACSVDELEVAAAVLERVTAGVRATLEVGAGAGPAPRPPTPARVRTRDAGGGRA